MKKKILIVDDEQDLLELIAEEFISLGHNVTIASSGNEGIEALTKNIFDIVLSDFKMPNGNGLALLNLVNTMSQRPVFYFVSAQADLSVEDSLKAGAKDFFSKPFDMDFLVGKVLKL